MTINLKQRMAAHKRQAPVAMREDVQVGGPISKDTAVVSVLSTVRDKLGAERVERRLIRELRPEYNTMLGAPRMHAWVHVVAKARRARAAGEA
jgi:hypothetical protein